MKILSVYYTEKPGGFCKRLFRLLDALSKQHTVHFAALDVPKTALAPNVTFHRIPFWTERRSGLVFWTTFVVWCPVYLGNLARKITPDRYVVFGAFYSAMLKIACAFEPAPITLFIRSLVFEINRITGKPRLVRLIADAVEKVGLANATLVVCMTKSMASAIERFAGEKFPVVVLPNDLPARAAKTLDLRQFLPERYENIALTSGVLDKRKNVDTVIDAWSAAAAGLAPHAWALVIAGEGPEKPALLQRCKDLGLQSVFFIGWIDALDSYLNSVQLVIHPSLHEGISNSILEAIANGAPVLVSKIPEHVEIFDSPTLLVGDGDWTTALFETLRNADALAKIGTETQKCGRKLNFDWDAEAVTMSTRSSSATTR